MGSIKDVDELELVLNKLISYVTSHARDLGEAHNQANPKNHRYVQFNCCSHPNYRLKGIDTKLSTPVTTSRVVEIVCRCCGKVELL